MKTNFNEFVNENKTTIGIGFTDHDDYLSFKEVVEENDLEQYILQDNGKFQAKEAWSYTIDIKLLQELYGLKWKEGLEGDFESSFLS